MISPFSFATEAELDVITGLVNALRDARTQETRTRVALDNVTNQLHDTQRRRHLDCEAAAARALGESIDTDTATPSVVDAAELIAQKTGLERRLAQAAEATAAAHGALRAGILNLLHECAQHAGDKYAQLARDLAEHWQLLYALEISFGDKTHIVPLNEWMSLKVPASEFIRGHKEVARREWHELLLESAARRGTSPQTLRHEIVEHGRRLFGEWPL